MLRDAAVAIITARCGNRTDLEAKILSEMRLVQSTKLEGAASLPWFLISEIETAVTVIDEPRVLIPTDFLREHEEGGLWIYRTDTDEPWTPLNKGNWGAARFLNQGSAIPEGYAIIGDYFYLSPTPDAVYTLKMFYYRRATVLETNIENDWLKWMPDLVIAETGLVIAALHLKDEELASYFSQQATEARARWQVFTEAREHEGRSYTMGEAP